MTSSSPLPSSSPVSSKRSHDGELAFLNHSPTTVANCLPPDVDNKPLARQKRRRTSKEDEEVLKAEYQKNPKPDKAARIEIVSKVALGEKEVQIWFQNKRQNDRRRSRPLDHPNTPSLMSSSSTMSDPPIEDETNPRDTTHEGIEPKSPDATPHLANAEPTTHPAELAEPIEPAKTADDTTEETRSEEQAEAAEVTEAATEDLASESSQAAVAETPEPEKPESQAIEATETTVDSSVVPSTDPQTADTAPTELSSSQQNVSSSQGASQSRTNWISNRRSASFMRSAEDYAHEVIAFPHPSQPATEGPTATRTMKRAHSFVRISTNEDGTARVVTDLDKTPSPPHHKTNGAPFARAAAGLRRSYSAAGLNERLAAASREERSPKLPRTSSTVGRSRDSRAWEFWCDPDSRYNTSLTTRAEQETSGSAADAIGLLRANRKILAQNQARQNTPVISRHQSAKMSPQYGVKKSRGPMQRASTVNGRLQSKGSDSSETDELPQTESDKENWAPDVPKTQRSRQVHQSPAVKHARRILGENTEIMSQSNSLGAMLGKSTPKKGGRRTSDPEQDEELRMFMGSDAGVSGRTTVSSAEEAGCVEGLLKLSQGQWR
ncbi:Homeobox protein yox1 [Kalmusia sp. IMI 367209]|nr:Homeobox protein yox1 [Kalmusia sp. IMI 367209]